MSRAASHGYTIGLVALAGTLLVGVPAAPEAPAARRATEAPVADAARRGDVEAVRSLLRTGEDVNAAQGDGMTALHWAAQRGDDGMARVLLGAGADVTVLTRLGSYTPLHIAAKGGHARVIERLLDAGADPNATTTTGGATALHFVAAAGNPEAARALLEHGANVDATESAWGQTPLMFAAAADRIAVIDVLLEGGADLAITASVVDIAAREEEDRADIRRRNERMAAARGGGVVGPGEYRAQREPQRQGQQPDQPGQALGVQQELRGTTEIDPLSYADLVGRYGGLSAVLLAAREGHVDAVTTLLDAGADINQVSAADRTTPMLMAAINGHFDLVKLLLDRGADPTAASDAGATPLYAVLNTEWAPKSRHPQPTDVLQQEITYLQLMEALLEAGADPNVRLVKPLWYTTYNNDLLRVDRTGATPFWRAAYATDVTAMRLLVEYGAEAGLPTTKVPARRFGRSSGASGPDPSGLPTVPIGGPAVYPIHAASGAGYGQGYAANSHRHVPDAWLDAVRYLVEEHGADVNARDLNGYSPVHHAAARGDNELIRYLVEQGADVTMVSRRGQTTVDMANGPVQRIQPFPETIALLERLGAKNNHNCVSC